MKQLTEYDDATTPDTQPQKNKMRKIDNFNLMGTKNELQIYPLSLI